MQLAQLAICRGWAVCCLNNRGTNSTPLHSSRTYCGAYTGDIRQVVDHIVQRRPNSPLFAVGFSLGANMLTKYIGEQCRSIQQSRASATTPAVATINCPTAAVVISNPWNFIESSRALRKLPIYDRIMAEGLVRTFALHYRSIGWDAHPELDIDTILNRTKSVYDFDEQVTRRVWGYASVDDYYRDASSENYLPHIHIPLLAINALDDPMIPPEAIPFAKFQENPNLLLATTPCGGHVGFAEGVLPVGDVASWAERVAVDFFNAM